MYRRKRASLMPAIALAGLSLMVALPTLSATRLYAAAPTRFASVTVQAGDTLWAIAASHTATGENVQDTIDRITEVNHLATVALQPGQRLRIPQ